MFHLALTGDIAEGRAHYDQALALYDPAEHRPLATRFGQDTQGVDLVLSVALALWMLGYPEAALADADQAVKDAREIGQAATLMFALDCHVGPTLFAENTRQQTRKSMKLVALADEKGASFWKAHGMTDARLRFGPDRQSLGRSPT